MVASLLSPCNCYVGRICVMAMVDFVVAEIMFDVMVVDFNVVVDFRQE